MTATAPAGESSEPTSGTVLEDTSGTAVVKALAAARSSHGGGTSGLALTLVVIVEPGDGREVEQATQAAGVAAAAHPCRLILVTRNTPTAPEYRLDAEVCVSGRLGPGEAVILHMFGRLALHAESVTLPLLAADVPVVAWWQGSPPERIARDPLGVFADRRITDCAAHPEPLTALRQRAIDYVPGDTDIAWTRTTPWRAMVAEAFDTIAVAPVSATVRGPAGNPSAALLAGWLRARTGVRVEALDDTAELPDGSDSNHCVTAVVVAFTDGSQLRLERTASRIVTLHRTGAPPRSLPLRIPDAGEALAEELRHLDPDQPYADALQAATGVSIPTGNKAVPNRARSSIGRGRVHEWHDPAAQKLAT